MAEVGVRGAGGDDEGVVGQVDRPPVRPLGVHDPARQVQFAHLGQQRAGVAPLVDDAAQRRGDQAG